MIKTLWRRVYLVIAISVLILPGQVHQQPAAAAQTLASLDPVQGLIQHQTASENPQDPQSWHTVTQRILISEGDKIRTDGVGLAYLTFFEGIQSEIQPNTLVVVSTLVLPEDGNMDVSLDVLVGTLYSTVEATLDAGERFEIHTPGATAAIRGTKWWTIVSPNGISQFATESGVVEIISHEPLKPRATPEPTPTLEPGETPEPMAVGAPPMLVPQGMELRADMGMLADRSGALDRLTLPMSIPERPQRSPLARATCGDGVCLPRERITCRVDCLDSIDLPTCGNGLCEPEANEDLLVCGADCGPWAGEQCGNGTCDQDESGITCPADCEPGRYFSPIIPALCGNGVCDPTESALNCSEDCRLGDQ
jgi:hypothetical protein